MSDKDLFGDVEVEEATLVPFWTPQVGENQIIIIDVPETPTEVELPKGSGNKQTRLFFKILDAFGKLGTWTVRYTKKVTTGSLLGQLTMLQRDGKLSKGSLIAVTRVGTGQASRYAVKHIKQTDEKKLEAKLKEIAENQKLAPKPKPTADLDKLF